MTIFPVLKGFDLEAGRGRKKFVKNFSKLNKIF